MSHWPCASGEQADKPADEPVRGTLSLFTGTVSVPRSDSSSSVEDDPKPFEVHAARPPSPRQRQVPWWVWVSLLPLGLGSWAPIVPGRRLKQTSWVAWGALWVVTTFVGWVMVSANEGGTVAGFVIIAGWCGAIATAFGIRTVYLQRRPRRLSMLATQRSNG
jgi:4-amino-4-deoxy-L-arabinose transferase-like glycosyltransferase